MRKHSRLCLHGESTWCLPNKLWNGVIFKGRPGNLQVDVFALFLFCKKQNSHCQFYQNRVSQNYSVLVYFKIQSHLLEFPSIWLILVHMNLWHLRYFVCMITETWIFIPLQEQERSWTKSKIIYFFKISLH